MIATRRLFVAGQVTESASRRGVRELNRWERAFARGARPPGKPKFDRQRQGIAGGHSSLWRSAEIRRFRHSLSAAETGSMLRPNATRRSDLSVTSPRRESGKIRDGKYALHIE